MVSYDPTVDISILDRAEPAAAPLVFADQPAKTGTDAVVLGYPGGGNFTATPARIREIIKLSGPDIYRDHARSPARSTPSEALCEQGNSGGPMIDLNGQVLGVVFGAAVDDADTGFVLTADEVAASAGQDRQHRSRCPPGPASAEPGPCTWCRNRIRCR